MTYEDLSERVQGTAKDLTDRWNTHEPLAGYPHSEVVGRVERFCLAKRITANALSELGTRIRLVGDGPEIQFCFPGFGRIKGKRTLTGIKYRELSTGRRHAEPYSVFQIPLVIGDPLASEWFIAEGETDAARLWMLVGEYAAIMVLPAGAATFRAEWARMIPRGANVYVALDADEPGERGASSIIRQLGGQAVRLIPDRNAKDWCEWSGDLDDFARLVKKAKSHVTGDVMSMGEVLDKYIEERDGSRPRVNLGFGAIDLATRGVSDGQVFGVAGRAGVGKTFLLNTITQNLAEGDHGSLVLSLEMPSAEWVERQIAMDSGVTPEEVEIWAMNKTLHQEARRFIERFAKVFICERTLQLDEIPSMITKARMRLGDEPLRAVLVDYMGLVNARQRDSYERVSAVAKGLKEIAKAEQLAVIVALQLNRFGGDGTVPVTLDMLRDSGVTEEALDFLVGMWRDHNEPSVVRTKILKNRRGPAGLETDLWFSEESRKLYETPVTV